MKIYVVMDYDHIVYAGHCLIVAKSRVCGAGCVDVWKDGKQIATVSETFQKGWVSKDYP